MSVNQMWFEGRWYQWLLLPLTLLFWAVSAVRRWLFRSGIKASVKIPVPVVIVGNLTVGGNGKTPLVVALCEKLSQQGFSVGVVSRGYGAKASRFPYHVTADCNATMAGDEPLLIAKRTGVPVVIDPVRPRGALALVNQHGCNVIISDDGLQHYALGRDIECVVTDRRLFGNGFLLPMGPMREGLWRLNTIDFLVLNSAGEEPVSPQIKPLTPVMMALKPGPFINVNAPEISRSVEDFVNESAMTALAGIGDPDRFFKQLSQQGLHLHKTVALADHHAIGPDDIPAGCVIMTEKDAVKASAYAHQNCWYQPVEAVLPESFYTKLTQKIALSAQRKEGL